MKNKLEDQAKLMGDQHEMIEKADRALSDLVSKTSDLPGQKHSRIDSGSFIAHKRHQSHQVEFLSNDQLEIDRLMLKRKFSFSIKDTAVPLISQKNIISLNEKSKRLSSEYLLQSSQTRPHSGKRLSSTSRPLSESSPSFRLIS